MIIVRSVNRANLSFPYALLLPGPAACWYSYLMAFLCGCFLQAPSDRDVEVCLDPILGNLCSDWLFLLLAPAVCLPLPHIWHSGSVWCAAQEPTVLAISAPFTQIWTSNVHALCQRPDAWCTLWTVAGTYCNLRASRSLVPCTVAGQSIGKCTKQQKSQYHATQPDALGWAALAWESFGIMMHDYCLEDKRRNSWKIAQFALRMIWLLSAYAWKRGGRPGVR